jgi:hypothetical protein
MFVVTEADAAAIRAVSGFACQRWRSRGSLAQLHPIAIEPVEHFLAGPMRAFRCFTVKAPNPRNSTRSPRARAAVIWSNTGAVPASNKPAATTARRRCNIGL